MIFLGLKMGTSYLAITQIATKYYSYYYFYFWQLCGYFGGQLIGGLQVFLLADDHEPKGFRPYKVELASCVVIQILLPQPQYRQLSLGICSCFSNESFH